MQAVHRIKELESQNAALLRVAKASLIMTNELLRTMDSEHWYAGDLTALQKDLVAALPPEVKL